MALLEVYKVVENNNKKTEDDPKFKIELDLIDTLDIKSARIYRPSKDHVLSGIKKNMIRIYFKVSGEMTVLEDWDSFSDRANVKKSPKPAEA